MKFEKLALDHAEKIISLASEVNPDISIGDLCSRLVEMFGYASYICFGLFVDFEFVGITSRCPSKKGPIARVLIITTLREG